MIDVAGVGIVDTAANTEAAEKFVEYLLSNEAQQYFVSETMEYALVGENIQNPQNLKPLEQIAAPDIDLSDLSDLQGTLDLLQSVGALD